MNILFLSISSAVSNLENRGIYPDLLRKFASEGHKVYIVCPAERRQKVKTNLTVEANVNILKVWTLNITKTNIIEKGLSTISISHFYDSAIQKYFKEINFDLILYSTPPITFNGLIKKYRRNTTTSYLLLKDIFPQNAIDLNLLSKRNPAFWFFRAKEKKLYQVSDYIGCMSPANVGFVLKNNPEVPAEKVEVCPNSIEIIQNNNNFDRKRLLDKYGIPLHAVILTFGGNLGKPQGIDFLLEVLDSNLNNRDIFFIISGDGTEFPVLKKWFDEKKPSNVLLNKALPKNDYDDLLSVCDVGLIFLNKNFTIPNYPSRLLSYMEKKLPVLMATDINTDIGSIAEENKYGFWVKSGDLESFNEKMSKLINDASLRNEMGENGYQFLLKEYTVDHSYEIIMKHFNNKTIK